MALPSAQGMILETQDLLKNDFIYLFMRDTQRQKEAETQAEGEAGSIQGLYPTWDSIPGLQDHALG